MWYNSRHVWELWRFWRERGRVMNKKVAKAACGRPLVSLVGAVVAMMAVADTPDSLTFITGGDLASTAVLSTDAAKPGTVFEGVSLDDYEPAYIYFSPGSSSGHKYFVCPDLHNEILRPYFVTRATENDAVPAVCG